MPDRQGSESRRAGPARGGVRSFDKALELDPQSVAALSDKGAASPLDRHEEAIACLDSALGLDPRDPAALTSKGASLVALGRYEEAVRAYDSALELAPKDAATWYRKGTRARGPRPPQRSASQP